jgi:hypothetical protein
MIEFLIRLIVFSFLSIVYSSEFVFWHFSLYTFKTVKFSMFVSEILRIWMSESEHKFDRDVIENLNDLETNVITRCLWLFSWSDKILLYVECEIVIWFVSIHDSCMHIMSIFFSRSYSRHNIIVFVDFAQLCCRNLIFWMFVLLIKSRVDHSFSIWFWLLENAHILRHLLYELLRNLQISMI